MPKSWIPHNDDALEPFANNFQALIAADPAAYGLEAGDAAAITAAYAAWHAAFLAAANPATRTKAAVFTKNAEKVNILGVVRRYAAVIRADTGVSNPLKIGLGLHIRDTAPTPIPPPATRPLLSIVSAGVGSQELRAADSATPSRRARPAGAIGLLLFCAVDEGAAPDPSAARFLTFLTRGEFTATFDRDDHGKTATYFARWTNSRGELGPWSVPVVARIAA